MEKVHSAMIGWMLSDKCNAFEPNGKKAKSQLLQDIFQEEESARVDEFDSIKVIIEWKNIDILVVTKLKDVEKCWIIENKIKSSQHSDQLNRYVKIMDCEWQMSSRQYLSYFKDSTKFADKAFKINPYKDKDKAYCFLSLIDEKPIAADSVNWKCTQYSKLAQNLELALRGANQTNKDYPFVSEYLSCITKLNDAINAFLKDHKSYPNVFTDGWMQKEEKSKDYKGLNKYISENGLETIFQKCFLSHIIPQTKFRELKDIVSETHGTALVDFPYCSIGNTRFGFQFQDGTFKVQVLEEYEKDDSAKIQAFLEKWEIIFPKDQKQLKNTPFYGWKKNESKEGKKAYISICKRQPRKSKKNPQKPWYDYGLDDIRRNWDAAFDECKSMMDKEVIPRNFNCHKKSNTI